jgi:hypothetical protein
MAGEGGRQAPIPNMNPDAHSHEALKAMTDAANPAGSQAIADGWAELAAKSEEAGQLFQRAIQNSEPGWTGEAAEAMRAHLARIAAWTRQTGTAYQAAGEAIGSQGEAAAVAKSSMPPPVPYDPAQMIRDASAGGNIADLAALPFRMYEQKQKHDAAHDEAARIVAARDKAFSESAGAVPSFTPPPLLGDTPAALSDDPVTIAAPHPRAPTRGEGLRRPPRPQPHHAPRPAAPSPLTPGPGPVAPSGVAPVSGPMAPSAPSQGPPAAARPMVSPALTPLPGPAVNPGPAQVPGAVTPSALTPGGVPNPGPVVSAGSAGAFGPDGFGPSGSGGFGPGGGPPPVVPSRIVAGAEAAPAAGSAKPAGDGERKRPEYLIEPDAGGMFGSDAVTSPPVIGEV